MSNLRELKYYIDSLCIFNFEDDEVIENARWLLDEDNAKEIIDNYSDFFKALAPEYSLKSYISHLILTNDNVFSRAAASGGAKALPKPVYDGLKSDLEKLEVLASLRAEDIIAAADEEQRRILKTMPKWETGAAAEPLTENWKNQIEVLIRFHQVNGYGEYAKYAAFTWRDGELSPITALNSIRLTDLKNYDRQRAQVVENTVAFIEGLPANNALLYGDRGTGKSSTIHAILNEYKDRGLRMIEISKGDISELTLIREQIYDCPMKFIIFIDDLSFDAHDDSFGELKAALEGSLSGRQSNTLIYATSNRRHLIKENFSDRENDVHRSDTMQEELSLSDRFGISVYFMNPDKKDYLDITEKIARDRGLSVDMEALLAAAEQWARRRGGRSPRCAKQFIDYVQSCEKRNIEWN